MTTRLTDLDADIAALTAWFEAHYGAPYTSITQLIPLEPEPIKTENYPMPDSYRTPALYRERPNKRKLHFDRDAYDAKVKELRAAGYLSIQDAAVITGRSVAFLRQDAAAGRIKKVDAVGFTQRGLNIPRFFVTREDLDAYLAWHNAGRQRPDKYRPLIKRAKTAQERG